MKKKSLAKRLLAGLLFFLLCLGSVSLSSCQSGGGSSDDGSGPLIEDGKLVLKTAQGEYRLDFERLDEDDLSEFDIVRNDKYEWVGADALMSLYHMIHDHIGGIREIKSDWVAKDEVVPTDTHEILIGMTNRAESPSTDDLRFRDYMIAYRNGRLIIAGGDEESTADAVQFYQDNFVDLADGSILFPTEDFVMRYDYPFDSVKINGISLADYAVKGAGYGEGVQPIKDFVVNMTGYAYSGKSDHTITITGDAAPLCCRVSETDGNIIIGCGEGVSPVLASKFFLSEIVGENDIRNAKHLNIDCTIGEGRAVNTNEIQSADTVDIFVSPDGSDIVGNGSLEFPYATIQRAKEQARVVLSASFCPVNVLIRGGDYYLTEPIVFDRYDSGVESAPVTYAAYEGEKVNIFGCTKVDPSRITAVTDPAITDRVIDKTAASKLMQMDLSDLYDVLPRPYSYGNTTDASRFPFTVYLGDTALSRSRYPNNVPNEGYLTVTKAKHNADKSVTFEYDKSTAEHIDAYWTDASTENLYTLGFFGWEWTSEVLNISSSVNFDKKTFTVSKALDVDSFANYRSMTRYYFFNLIEEIDVPGESYVDYNKRVIYFYPTETFDKEQVYIGSLSDSMFKMRDVSHLTVDGLNFMYTGKNAIELLSSGSGDWSLDRRYVTIRNCTIAHTSDTAMELRGRNITVSGCTIYDTANGGIAIYGGRKSDLTMGDSVIENCLIYDYNRAERVYFPAINACSMGLVIRHNEIYGGIHEMIAVNANDVVIEYNNIHHGVTDTSDMGAIYFGRDPSLMGIVVRYNYIHDIGNTYGGTGQQSVYVDDGNAGADIYGNIFLRAAGQQCNEPGAVKTHGSQFSQIYNNIFIDTDFAYDGASWGGGRGKEPDVQVLWYKWLYDRVADKPHAIIGKIQSSKFGSDIWRKHYEGTMWEQMFTYINPDLIRTYASLGTDELEKIAAQVAPKYSNIIENNVLVNTVPVHELWGKNYTLGENYQTDDHGIFVKFDEDFSLTEEGLAAVRSVIPNFEPIDFSSIGIQKNG